MLYTFFFAFMDGRGLDRSGETGSSLANNFGCGGGAVRRKTLVLSALFIEPQ